MKKAETKQDEPFVGEPPEHFVKFAELLRPAHDLDSQYNATQDLLTFFQEPHPLFDEAALEEDRMFDITVRSSVGKLVFRDRNIRKEFTTDIITKLLRR